MKEYKRLTEEELNDFTSRVVVQLEPTLTQQVMSLILELTEYRTKIENGTLIEIDHSLIGEGIIGIHHYTDGTYQLDLDENIVIGFAIDGVITWNGTHHFNDEFRNGMFFIDNEKGRAEAEKKLKELQNER